MENLINKLMASKAAGIISSLLMLVEALAALLAVLPLFNQLTQRFH